MFRRGDLPPEVTQLMLSQFGAVAWTQAAALGTTRKVFRRHAEDWLHLGRGLYLSGEPSFPAMVWAGLRKGTPNACIGGAAALRLAGILRQDPTDIVVWTTATESKTPLIAGDFRVRFKRSLRQSIGDPARSTVEDSLLDFANGTSYTETIAAITRAFLLRQTTPGRLTKAVEQRNRQRHRERITDLCSPDLSGIESLLEYFFELQVLSAHALPRPQRQVRLTQFTRSDVLFEEFSTIVELDGRDHSDFSRDMTRDNNHALVADMLTLRYGWEDVVRRSCAVAEQVAQVLQQRGWTGTLTPCPHCPSSATRQPRQPESTRAKVG